MMRCTVGYTRKRSEGYLLTAYITKSYASAEIPPAGTRVGHTCEPHSPHPQNGREAARCNKFTPPKTQKTSPMSPPPSKSETNLRFVNGGDMGEVLGERGRFGGREPPLSRGGSLPPRSFSKVFPLTSSAPPVRGAFSSFLSCGVRCSESSCADGSTSA